MSEQGTADPALAVDHAVLIDELLQSDNAAVVAAVARIQLRQMKQHRDQLLAAALEHAADEHAAADAIHDAGYLEDPDNV